MHITTSKENQIDNKMHLQLKPFIWFQDTGLCIKQSYNPLAIWDPNKMKDIYSKSEVTFAQIAESCPDAAIH